MKTLSVKFALIGAALLIAGAGCSSKAEEPQAKPPVGDVVPVTYNPGTLDKQDISLKIGDSIEFRNSDLKSHLPASNPHPAHTDYPEFVAPSEIKPGEVWQMKFTRAGDFKFHDHLNAANVKFQGVVHVK